MPADVRRLQHIFPTLDIRLAFEDETFYRSMEAYRSSLRSKGDVMVLDPSSDFFKYLKNPGRGKTSAP